MLLRVDISTYASGSLLITLSDQGTGFAPYRLDNCTPFTLHLRYTQTSVIYVLHFSMEFHLANM